LLYLVVCEEAESSNPDCKMHSCEYNSVGDLQAPQVVPERAGKAVQEDSHSVGDTLAKNSATEKASSNGNQTDLQNICRELVAHVEEAAVDGREQSDTCDGAADGYEPVKLIQNESYMVGTDTWESLPNQICRLCASIDEHPKQSIVGWLGMLNEVIPGLVSYLFLSTDLCTLTSLQNMYRYVSSSC
jgi:hypothetical protein